MNTNRLFLCVVLLFLSPSVGLAQESSLAIGRNSKIVTTGLTLVADQVADSIVDVFDTRHHLCLGTVVSKEGLIVTKASELGRHPLKCRFNDESILDATIVATSVTHDLALLQVVADEEAKESRSVAFAFTPISFQSNSKTEQGSLVVTVDTRDNKPLLGIVTSNSKSLKIENSACTDCITTGIEGVQTILPQLQQFDSVRNKTRRGFRVLKALPRSLAEDCGLLAGDIIVSANKIPIQSKYDLARIERTLRAGDKVEFTVYRKARRMILSTRISLYSNRVFQDRWGGGPYNRRRFNFPSVLTHDIPIRPDQCGGPLVDLRGSVVGINVARSLRVATLAIPLNTVRDFIRMNQPTITLRESFEK